jgi:hypothetical protein
MLSVQQRLEMLDACVLQCIEQAHIIDKHPSDPAAGSVLRSARATDGRAVGVIVSAVIMAVSLVSTGNCPYGC